MAVLLVFLYVTFCCVYCYFPIWCFGSGVMLDCMYSVLWLLSYFNGDITNALLVPSVGLFG